MAAYGIIINPKKKKYLNLVRQVMDEILHHGYSVALKPETARLMKMEKLKKQNLKKGLDMVFVFGGDGTLLSAARTVSPSGTPLFGINVGGFGFLTEVSEKDALNGVRQVLKGSYFMEKRMMLEVSVERKEKVLKKFLCLNDMVVTQISLSRLVHWRTQVHGEYIATYPADGMIVSTPTGSTAYSLSAGGAIVHPELNVLLLTPICPHTLYARPLVLTGENEIRITAEGHSKDIMLTLDGQEGHALKVGDHVVVRKAACVTHLVRLNEKQFYHTLRTKLFWGEREAPSP